MKKVQIKELILDIIIIATGCVAYSVAVVLFLEPAKISPGGLTGIATLINYALDFPTGLTVFVLNIPLLIAGYFGFGGTFIVKTALSVALSSFLIDMIKAVFPPFNADTIICAIFGGILAGAGLSLVMLRGSTTGGIDIAVKLLNRRYNGISIGRLYLYLDGFIIVMAALVYGDIESALYTVLAIFLSSRIIDTFLYGNDSCRLFFIITDSPDELENEILGVLKRGVTEIKAIGGFSGGDKTLLMCVVRTNELALLKKIIQKSDSKAFYFITSVSDIYGNGFYK